MDLLERAKLWLIRRLNPDASLYDDVCYRMRVLEGLVLGDKVTSFQLILIHHLIDGFTIQDNTPSVGYIAWSSLHIVHQGVDYTITNGNTNQKYAWWDKSVSTTTLQTTDTLPTLADDDIIVFLNKDGTHVTVPLSEAIDGSLIVSESILADALSANSVTSAKIYAGAVIAEKIAAGAVTTVKLDALAVTVDKLAANAVTTAKLAANTIETAHIKADQVTAGKISVVGVDANGQLVLGEIGSGDIDNIGDGSTYGKVKITQLSSGEVIYQTADKDGLTIGDYVGKIVFDTGEGVHYTSDGTDWLVVNLSAPEVWSDEKIGVRTLTHNPVSAAWYGSGSDGVVTISSNTDLGNDSIKYYKALTVNADVTLSGNSPMFIFAQEELILNGTIKVNPHKVGGAGGVRSGGPGDGGNGGDGGGILYVYARKITGTGKIEADATSGGDGADATQSTGNHSQVSGESGQGCECLETTYAAAGGGSGVNGGAAGVMVPNDKTRKWRIQCISDYGLYSVSANRIALSGSGGGGASGCGYTSFSNTCRGGGGGGGGSIFTAGGDGSNGAQGGTSTSGRAAGGGGGGAGGGGVIFLVSENAVDTLTLEAKGGNGGDGGDGYSAQGAGGGGGGGGCGGFVFCLTNIEPTTITTTPGTAGAMGIAGSGGGGGTGGTTGDNVDYPTRTFRETSMKVTCPCCLGIRKKASCSPGGAPHGEFCFSLKKCPTCGSYNLDLATTTCSVCNGEGEVDRGHWV